MFGSANVANNNINMVNNISKSVKQSTITNTSNSASATSMVSNEMLINFRNPNTEPGGICQGLPEKCSEATRDKNAELWEKLQKNGLPSKDLVAMQREFNEGQSNASVITAAAATENMTFSNDIKDAVLNSQEIQLQQVNDKSGNEIIGPTSWLSAPQLGPSVNVTNNRQDIVNSVSTAIDQVQESNFDNSASAMSLIDNKLVINLPNCNGSTISLSNEAIGSANAEGTLQKLSNNTMENLMKTDLQNQTKTELMQDNEGAEGFLSTGVIIAIVCCCVFPALFI